MTKKDYELIAKAVCETYNTLKYLKEVELREVIRVFVLNISFKLRDDNPRFDSNKFIKACGL